ncbi:MAG: sporulation protein YabP [Ruminococcaceae bacterium]|nr:sporulation protein YabP [Oscillospiraceae bacterium]
MEFMQNGGVHNIILEGRKKISVSGVQDMECFDENKVVVYTSMGALEINGANFHMNKLSLETEEIIIEGDIDSIIYEDTNAPEKSKKSLVSRLFG